MSKELSTSGKRAIARRPLPESALVTARLAESANHFVDVLFKCSFEAKGRLTRALAMNGPRANTAIEIVPAHHYEQHRKHLTERLVPGIFRDERGEFSFCARVTTTNMGRPEYVCDLEGFVISDEGTFIPCDQLPKLILDELERNLAKGATRRAINSI